MAHTLNLLQTSYYEDNYEAQCLSLQIGTLVIINFDCRLGGINIAMEDANESRLWVCL